MVMSLVEQKQAEAVAAIDAIDRLVTARFDRLLAPSQLSYAQLKVLEGLATARDGAWTVTALAESLSVKQPAASKIVQRLVVKGLLEVRPDPGDRRLRSIQPTAAGHDAIRRGQALLRDDMRRYFAGWQDQERDTFHRLLRRLRLWLDGNRGTFVDQAAKPGATPGGRPRSTAA
jgi:DNA-binding MarR family transcriptional regulator